MKSIDTLKNKINAGCEVTLMGKPVPSFAMPQYEQFSKRFNFSLPSEYFDLLSFSDGMMTNDRLWFSFAESLKTLIIFQNDWIDSSKFWPISDDGCGNYYCIDQDGGICFFDTMESKETPSFKYADSVDDYLEKRITE